MEPASREAQVKPGYAENTAAYRAWWEKQPRWHRFVHWWRSAFRPFGLCIIIARPKVDHSCLIHGHDFIGGIYSGRYGGPGIGCRACLKN